MLESNRPLSITVAGAGPWGLNWIRTLVGGKVPGVVLHSVVTTKPERLGPELRACVVTSDHLLRTLDQISRPDGVIVATPPSAHREMVLACAERGVGCLVEKPVSLDLLSAEEMIRAAQANNALLAVDYVHLFNPAFRAFRTALGNRAIRSLSFRAGNLGPFREGYSDIWDYAPHDLSLAMALLGSKIELSGVERSGCWKILRLVGPHGQPVEIQISNQSPEKIRYARVEWDGSRSDWDDLRTPKVVVGGNAIPVEDTRSSLEVALEEFATAVRTGRVSAALKESLDFSPAITRILEKASGEAG